MKHEDKKQKIVTSDDWQVTSENDNLESILENVKKVQEDKISSDEITELKQKIEELESKNKELSEIAKKAQLDYLNLKTDFDMFHRQIKEANKNMEVDSLISMVKKFLPFIEDLRKSLEHVWEWHSEDPLTKWVQMIYDKFLKTLESLNIKPIQSIWLEPDSIFHEPVNVVPSWEENKWKIVQEYERWFYYEKDGEKKIIVVSKVVVGG